ncbi:MAG: MFS transporter [Microcoleus sp. PH2017_01_SCD_O_A]|uniref:MFS transporter n=1 Tax=unclassified Microcoleus TaxID=2642155 RepID=UPI001DF4DF42|nr:MULTISPECIES: MFS transporter [unclassified Microcoleus]MCC3419838.1 MFS transporter [Microcoleus sp. PH2017_07_MST_O_A]MCC3508949.1 MFS transporter [Microcoleus sp. PH2017_17_BER_D_A]TAE42637.1 MAG: MFS transporter [Oscillatoriales cyanobacterium]MCC3425074.1 MFS transporter [Microcoleus sp. PH2017_01_SCD_O_A]MCC3434183.1 MFS transporter [Microcoleus sp. PH2017_05_CCC_O_A]
MNIFRDIEPQPKRSLVTLFTAGLLFWCSLASLLPTLPLYVQSVGGSKQQIGFVMGAFAIGLLLSRPQLGKIADSRGRKQVLLLGVSVAALAPIGYLLAQSVPLLLFLRAFHGISIAAFTTAYSALVTDLSPPGKRGELIGYMSLAAPIGLAFGPAMGGFIQAGIGYPALFAMSAAFATTALFITTKVVEPNFAELTKSDSLSEDKNSQKYWQMLWNPRVRIPALVLLLVGLVFGTLSTFMPLFIQETKVNLNPGLFYSTAAIASFSLRLVTGRASDKYGRGLFISGGLICYAVSMLLLYFANSSGAFLIAALVEGTAGGTVMPMMVTLMSDRCEPQERGRLFSICIGGFDLGIALAGPTLGFVAEQVGYRNMFGLAAVLAALALLIFVTLCSKNLSHSLKFAIGRGKDVYALNR